MECSRKVMDVLNELGAEPENLMFHAIHRIGNPNNTTATSTSAADSEDRTATREEGSRPVRPRPVIVRFVSRMDSDWVVNNRRSRRLKAGFHMIADRRSQIAIRSAIVCDPAIVIADDRRR